MSLLAQLTPANAATIAIDCLNTFMKADGLLSIASFQHNSKGLVLEEVQAELNRRAERMGELRRFLFSRRLPQIQFQDAHVIESIHGKRYHSLELVREGEEPDFLRSFPPHALLDKNRRFGTLDQMAVDEIKLPHSREVFIRWFESSLPAEAKVAPETELIFLKDDFCMSPGSPHVDKLFWELRRQGRFNLVVFGVCDEVCNLRNVLLMLASIFNVVYVQDCTFPLSPEKREPAINYMRHFNPLGDGSTGHFEVVAAEDVIAHFSQ